VYHETAIVYLKVENSGLSG